MATTTLYPRGSEWRKWDLQVQTILDDNYVSLERYYQDPIVGTPEMWDSYVEKVGGEENALKYDSRVYFNNEDIDIKERRLNYVRNFFAFQNIFRPELACVCLTDHNYFDNLLKE